MIDRIGGLRKITGNFRTIYHGLRPQRLNPLAVESDGLIIMGGKANVSLAVIGIELSVAT